MIFNEVLDQVRELLQSKGRISYRALKVQFKLDDESLEALKDELIEAERVASDENSKVLVWTGGEGNGESENRGNTKRRPWTPDFGPRTLDSCAFGRAHSGGAGRQGSPGRNRL